MISPLASRTFLLLIWALLVLPCPGWSLGPSQGGFVPFDRELYELGHKIFLANGNLADALRLSEAALASRPDDSLWRARAARIAEWQGEPHKALSHWFHLATVNQDREAQVNALRLAEETGDLGGQKILLKQSLLARPELETLKSYLRVCQVLGETQEAIALLELQTESDLAGLALAQLPSLYEAAGDPDQAIQALTLASRAAPTAEILLRLARLQFSRGDPQGAYLTLKEGQPAQLSTDRPYLEARSDLCWMMQDTECAAAASKQLLAQDAGREEDSRRLFLSAWQTDPELAFATAIDGWRRFGKLDFLGMSANLGRSQRHWEEIAGLLSGMSPQEQARFASSSEYWLLRSRVYRHLGMDQVALADFRKAMGLEPGNQQLAAGYLWLLLDLDRYDQLQRVAGQWLEKSGAPVLADAMGAAYSYLGDDHKALMLYRSRFAAHRDDPAWLVSYAHLLEQNGLNDAAAMARLQGLELVKEHLAKQQPGAAEPLEDLTNYVALSLPLQQGDQLDGAVRQILLGEGEQARDLIPSWALATDRHDAARLWLRRNLGGSDQPSEGVQLSLALAQNDRPKIAALMESSQRRLPYRDAVEGARRIGALPLSEEIAWQRSWQNPDDPRLFGQLQELLESPPASLGYRLRLLDRAGVGGLENRFDATVPVTRRLRMFSVLSQTHNDPLETGVIGSIPSRDWLARLGVETLFDQGKASLAGGVALGGGRVPLFRSVGKLSPGAAPRSRLGASVFLFGGGDRCAGSGRFERSGRPDPDPERHRPGCTPTPAQPGRSARPVPQAAWGGKDLHPGSCAQTHLWLSGFRPAGFRWLL